MVLLRCLREGFWRTLFAYSGPGALVAVGYMDQVTGQPPSPVDKLPIPINVRYLDVSKFDRVFLQYMAAKLGMVTRWT